MDNGEQSFVDVWDINHSSFGADGDGATEIEVTDDMEQPSGEGQTEPNSDAVVVEDQGAEQGGGEPAETEEESANNAPSEAPSDTAEQVGEYEDIMTALINSDVLNIDSEKEYDVDTESGLSDMITDTVERRTTEALSSYKEGLGEKAAGLLTILEQGGSVDDFISQDKQTQFGDILLESDSGEEYERNQQYLVEDWLKVQGYDEDEVRDLVYDYKDNGMLRKQAEMSQRKLSAWQEGQNQAQAEERQAAQAEEARVAQEQADTFKETVLGTRDLSGFAVSEKKAQKMYDYITLQDKDGQTQFQKDDTPDNRLLYAMFAMDGFDKDKLSKEVSTKQARSFKKKLSNFQDTNVSPKRSDKQITRDNQGAPKVSWNM